MNNHLFVLGFKRNHDLRLRGPWGKGVPWGGQPNLVGGEWGLALKGGSPRKGIPDQISWGGWDGV